jgi:hypothetical protein
MNELNRTLSSVTHQLRANALIRCALLAATVYLFAASMSLSVPVSTMVAGLGFLVGAILTKPFENKRQEAIQLIHQSVGDAEYSLPLLDKQQLNIAEQLQLERLTERIQRIRIPGVLFAQAGLYVIGLLIALVVYVGYPLLRHRTSSTPKGQDELTTLTPDTKPISPPTFLSATVQIQPPAYTRLPVRQSGDLNVVALVNSQLMWQVQFSDTQNLSFTDGRQSGQRVAISFIRGWLYPPGPAATFRTVRHQSILADTGRPRFNRISI